MTEWLTVPIMKIPIQMMPPSKPSTYNKVVRNSKVFGSKETNLWGREKKDFIAKPSRCNDAALD
ncbi:hypothetical protein PPOP_1470 [Paenibacillus popilliae ATCC 14706]|uniref:Uncharacterized protein n=1 Tax=Paenibacillus popilliae ATCC 14706 TaxID=1212764 RepID=M9M4B0_PAEPP|nr:hypothetical protein PPOP_1470 [Paenibacillus popilliae ATCC 14706]